MALGTSAFLAGDADAAVRAWQRGYQERVGAGDPLGAVDFAFWIGTVLGVRGEWAVAAGWAARAQRILETAPEDVVERGYLLVTSASATSAAGIWFARRRRQAEVVQIGRRFDDADLVAQGLVSLGRICDLHRAGFRTGWPCWTRPWWGSRPVRSRRSSLGWSTARVIEACQELADFSRMSAWTRALTRWCETQPGLVPFTGSAHCIAARSSGCTVPSTTPWSSSAMPNAERRPAGRRPRR